MLRYTAQECTAMINRNSLKRWIPPAILETARPSAGRLFPTWQEARNVAGDSYSSELVNRFRIDRALENPDVGETPQILLGSALLIGKPDIEIVDFGGSTGWHAVDLQKRLPSASYTVVENEVLVSMARTKLSSTVKFVSKIPNSCDIFFSSCALHYMDDYKSTLNAAFRSAKRACIFIRNNFSADAGIRVQRSRLFNNGAGKIPAGYSNQKIKYPCRSLLESDVLEIARIHQFDLAMRLIEPKSWPATRDVYGMQLLFVKNA